MSWGIGHEERRIHNTHLYCRWLLVKKPPGCCRSAPWGKSARCQGVLSRLVLALLTCDSGRGMSRHVGTCRDRSHLFNVGDVLIYRRRRYEIFFTEARFDAAAVEVTLGAVSLNAAGRARETGTRIALQCLVDGQRKIAVGAGRDLSRQVVGH